MERKVYIIRLVKRVLILLTLCLALFADTTPPLHLHPNRPSSSYPSSPPPQHTLTITSFQSEYSSNRELVLSKIWSFSRPQSSTYDKYSDSHSDTLSTASVNLVINDPNVTCIGHSTFELCPNLVSLTMPYVKRLSYKSFYSCSNLVSVNAPMLEEVGDKSFFNCTSLRTVEGCRNFKFVGVEAFNNCNTLYNLPLQNYTQCSP